MGESRGKKFCCKLGALQRAFPKSAFLRHGGDALTLLHPYFSQGMTNNIGSTFSVGDTIRVVYNQC